MHKYAKTLNCIQYEFKNTKITEKNIFKNPQLISRKIYELKLEKSANCHLMSNSQTSPLQDSLIYIYENLYPCQIYNFR